MSGVLSSPCLQAPELQENAHAAHTEQNVFIDTEQGWLMMAVPHIQISRLICSAGGCWECAADGT